MQADFSRMSVRTDEEMRTVRLARGLRAVAATMIVGGIVIAALERSDTEREVRDAGDAGSLRSVAAASTQRCRPGIAGDEPALERIERSMEHPG